VADVRVLGDAEVDAELLDAVRSLTFAAFADRFDAHDWEHTFGGTRVVAFDGEHPVATAAVVPRLLVAGEQPFRCGYVEGVATAPSSGGRGHGAAVMAAATDVVRATYELGALSTALQGYYERWGWTRWQGATYVRHPDRLERTADEDDGVMVLRTGPSAGLDLTASISCEARAGDDW
jgi:aminoglycoside 2'-N-acetyltransferase I